MPANAKAPSPALIVIAEAKRQEANEDVHHEHVNHLTNAHVVRHATELGQFARPKAKLRREAEHLESRRALRK
jgi:hypothetical protein